VEHKTLGRYLILGELGRGAMGAVFRAKDPLIEREVAIKTLLPTLPDEVMAEVRERFLREARSAGRLNHPNIVTIFDVGQQGDTAYIAMELLEGRSLQQMMRETERLSFDAAAELAAQLADGLDHAHRFAIVHRDVKPANVMVGPSGRAKLTDFGVAHVASSTVTQTGAAVGSPRYMSPEQVLGQPVDARSDVFSLGSVLYEMLTRRAPFDRAGESNVFLLMNRIAGEAHVPAREIDPGIPAALDRIANKALAKKPEDRYQRAMEMASDLRNWRNAARGEAGERSTMVVPPRQKPQASPAVADILGDLDAFSKQFDLEAQEIARKTEEEKQKKQEAERRAAAHAAAAAETAKRQREAQAASAAPAPRRSGALDMLRSRPSAAPKEDPAVTRKKAVLALNQAMREADKFLAEFMHEVSQRQPECAQSYPFMHFGALPNVVLSEGMADSRPRRVDDIDCLSYIVMRFRVSPMPPAKQLLNRDDFAAFETYLKNLGAVYELAPAAKNDFGQVTKAVFTVTGGPKCEITINADYAALNVTFELNNVRKPGRRKCVVPAAEFFGDLADELARYMLGADEEFEKRLAPAK